jgi:hypothetical protein
MSSMQTRRHENGVDDRHDDRTGPVGWAQGLPSERPPRGFLDRRRFVESKWSFRTTELLTLVLGTIGILVAASQLEDLDGRYAWTLVTALGIGYLLSRGIAKSGKGTYADD